MPLQRQSLVICYPHLKSSQRMHVSMYVYTHARLFLPSASKCLRKSLLKKEELAGLEDLKRSLPSSVTLWLQTVIAGNHCESLITWRTAQKKENPNHTLTSGHLCHFEKLWRHTKPLLTEAHDQMSV